MFYLCLIFFLLLFSRLHFPNVWSIVKVWHDLFCNFFTFWCIISLFLSIICSFIIIIMNCRVSTSLISFDWYNCFLTLFHLSINHLTFFNFVLTHSVRSLFYWLFYYFRPFIINVVYFLCWFYFVFFQFFYIFIILCIIYLFSFSLL